MFNNVALDLTFMVALSNLNKSFNGSKGKPTGNLVFYLKRTGFLQIFGKKNNPGIVRWSCNPHAGLGLPADGFQLWMFTHIDGMDATQLCAIHHMLK